MITAILNSSMLEFIVRRYDTDSFDEALEMCVDDWVDGKIKWDDEEIASAYTPEWMAKNGYADDDIEPTIDRINEVVSVAWFCCHDDNELIIEGRFIKSAPVEEDDWPTAGLEGNCFL